MCGIAGFAGPRTRGLVPEAVIRSMAESLAHRGPDGQGSAVYPLTGRRDACVALGHRRLSIIDLSPAGRQPMESSDGRLSIVFNGEIYNYLELKQELKARGRSFVSHTDTEVALKAYAEWGLDAFARFNGMWALALYDRPRGQLILSRDRLGKKPLYVTRTRESLLFASEVKALLRYPGVAPKPALDKVFRYLAGNYRYVDSEESSFFAGVSSVPKGCSWVIGPDLAVRERRYWRLSPAPGGRPLKDKDAVARFRELLADSVRLRLRSDVPVGCMLSGGLDSTAIVCTAHKLLKTPIRTFSGVTGRTKGVYDESEYIDAVVRETGAEHHYIRPDPADLFETLDEMLSRHDEPVCTVTWYNLYLIAKKVRLTRTPVILNGHGGDELTAGYWDYYHYHFRDLEKAGDSEALAREISLWTRNHGRDPAELARTRNYILALEKGRVSETSRFPDYSACLAPEIAPRRRKPWPNPFRGWLSRRLYSDLLHEAIPPSLRAEDRNTMSQSIESRSPFLDYRLIEFCFSLPGSMKIRNGLGKWVLREAMRGLLPESVRARKDKTGFVAPADEWFRGVNREPLWDLIRSSSFRGRGLFNPAQVERVFEEHLSGRQNHQMFLWQLINLELWLRRFFAARPSLGARAVSNRRALDFPTLQ